MKLFPLDVFITARFSCQNYPVYITFDIVTSRHNFVTEIIPDRLASSGNRRPIRYTFRDATIAIRYNGNVVLITFTYLAHHVETSPPIIKRFDKKKHFDVLVFTCQTNYMKGIK